ncbi:MAG: sigma-54-dependent Fis family transcriptional regulator, partial [Acidobacteria bacterium]
LVVDDEPSMRLGMSRVLERAGWQTASCAAGDEALEALRARPWDAMVTDVRMPRMSGTELLSRALALRPGLRVIVVTAFGTVEQAVDAVRRGACDYLLKPIAPATLVAAVGRAIGDRGADASEPDAPELVAESPAFRMLLERVARAARTDSTVLLCGESGSGKEVVARAIHHRSRRASGPFVAVNCAALPAGLLEAELFGVRRGAFTGADRDRPGHFQRADGGTLLLDEVGELPLELQAKLLRALESREVIPLGSEHGEAVDVRIVAATHRDLRCEVAEGRFRGDLFFRLSVIPLTIPPLRERPEDIRPLAEAFAREAAARTGLPAPRIGRDALARLARHPWPGNVRELRNVIERAVVLGAPEEIRVEDLSLDDWSPVAGAADDERLRPGLTIAEAERILIERTLEAEGGNRTRASEKLGISVRTLRNKLRRFREERQAAPHEVGAR